jgi:hypothetical protein
MRYHASVGFLYDLVVNSFLLFSCGKDIIEEKNVRSGKEGEIWGISR